VLPAICLFGLLGAFLLLKFADKVNKANRYLAYHFMLNSLFGFAHWASVVSDSSELRTLFAIHYFPFYLLNTPFLYFYVRAILTDRVRLSALDTIHFVPFLIVLLNIIPYTLYPWSFKLDFAQRLYRDSRLIYQVYFPLIPFSIYFIFRSVLSLVYIFLGGKILWQATQAGKLKSAQELKRWIMVCLGLVAVFNVSLIIFSFVSLYVNQGHLVLDSQGRGRSVATFIMSAMAGAIYFFPKILYGLQAQAGNSITDVMALNEKINKASKSSEFSAARLKLVEKELIRYLPGKHYLAPGFCLADLVRDLGMPEHLLTYYFNNYKGLTFLKWKNQLRIQEAILLLKAGEAETNTLESVGKACGYKSRSNFIDSFKSQTGESPSVFLKKLS
jgi:AraC-like DNA-binding protein